MASLAPSALTSFFGLTANTSNIQEASESPGTVRSRFLLCQYRCLPCSAEERLFRASGAPAWLAGWGGSTGLRDAAAPLEEEDAALLLLARGNTRGSPCSSQLIRTAGIRLSPPSSSSEKRGGLKAISDLLHKDIASGSNKCTPQTTGSEEGHLLWIPLPTHPSS